MTVSQDIIHEVVFLFHSLLLGAAITFIYDGFLILRRLFKHTMFLVSLEDFIFWAACAVGVFGVLYKENDGMLRWFSVAGAAIGMLIYKKTVSPLIINTAVKALSFLLRLFLKALRILLKPFAFLFKKAGKGGRYVGKKTKRAGVRLKKKLTGCKKELKILLHKH